MQYMRSICQSLSHGSSKRSPVRLLAGVSTLVILLAACAGNGTEPAGTAEDTTEVEDPTEATEASEEDEAATGDTASDDFPTSRINYVIPFGPGGASDFTARVQQEALEAEFGQTVAVTYQEGASGGMAWSQLKNMPNDGHTFVGVNAPNIIVDPIARGDAGYTSDDFRIVTWFQYTPSMLGVPADSPHETLDDLVAEMQERPGAVNFAAGGDWSQHRVAHLIFQEELDVEGVYVPHDGGGQAAATVLGGHTEAGWFTGPDIVDMLDDIRILAVAADEPMAITPDAPTFLELGHDIVMGAYRGVAVPHDTPEERVQRIADVFERVNQDPDIVEQMEASGFDLVFIGADEADAFVDELADHYIPLVERSLE